MDGLSSITRVEKNKLTSNSVWLTLLEISIPGVDETIRIVSNNEDISWNSHTWQKFPFELDEISQKANAEISTFAIRVANVNNIIGQYLRTYDVYVKKNGHKALEVILYMVNSKDLDNQTPVFSTNLTLTTSSINHKEVVFTLGSKDLFSARTPQYRMFPNSCRFKFKDSYCKYAGSATSCDKSLKNCKQLNNSSRYGGFPSIGNTGVSQ